MILPRQAGKNTIPMLAVSAGVLLAISLAWLGAGDNEGRLGSPGKVELPLVEFAERPGVEVEIGDRGPYPFLIGAKAGPVLLDRTLTEELELEPEGVLPRIGLGEIQLVGLSFEQDDVSGLLGGAGAPRGILGLDSFAPYLVTLDTPDRALQLETGTLEETPEGAVVPYQPGQEGILTVPVRIGRETVPAQIDIGGGGHLSLNNRYIEALPLASEPTVIGRSITAVGEFPVFQAGFEGIARLGDLELPLTSLRFMESVPDAVLGRDLLAGFRITFDPGRKRARFVPDRGKPLRMQEMAAMIANLDPDRPVLRDSFNADPGKVRLLLILSPT